MTLATVTANTVPTKEAFVAWMQDEFFTDRTLAAALGCHHTTVWKWATGRTTLDSIAWIACRAVAGNNRDRERRRKSLVAVEDADQRRLAAMRGSGTARREAEAAAASR